MAIKQIGNTGVYVIDVSNEQTNKTNYATLVSDLRWKLWNKVQDEQDKLAKLDMSIWQDKADAVEARRKSLQSSRDKLAKGLADAKQGNITVRDLIALAKADASLAAAAQRLQYSEEQKNKRFNAANELKLALASADQTTLVDATNPITGQLLVGPDGQPVSKQITRKGKSIVISTPKARADGLVEVEPEDVIDTKTGEVVKRKGEVVYEDQIITVEQAQELIKSQEKADGKKERPSAPGQPTATGRMDAAARALGFKDTADFLGQSGDGVAESDLDAELAKIDRQIAELKAPSYDGRTGSLQDTRQAYARDIGVGGLFGMEPRASRALPFFDESRVAPALKNAVDKRMQEYETSLAALDIALTPEEKVAARADIEKALGKELETTISPIDNLPVAYPVSKGDFLKDRKTYKETGRSEINLGFQEAPSEEPPVGQVPPQEPQTPPAPAPTPQAPPAPALPAPQVPQVPQVIKLGEPPSRPGIMGQEIPPAIAIPQVPQVIKPSEDLDLYRDMIGGAGYAPVPTPTYSPGGALYSSYRKQDGSISTPTENFAPPAGGYNMSPTIPYEMSPFATTEEKMQMDAIRRQMDERKKSSEQKLKETEINKEKAGKAGILGDQAKALGPQDRRAMYAVNVVKKATELAEKPKKFERLAKSELPETERKKKVAEHILVADALYNTNKGKKDAFQAAYDELNRVYNKNTELREEAQAYLIAKNMLEDNVNKPT